MMEEVRWVVAPVHYSWRDGGMKLKKGAASKR